MSEEARRYLNAGGWRCGCPGRPEGWKKRRQTEGPAKTCGTHRKIHGIHEGGCGYCAQHCLCFVKKVVCEDCCVNPPTFGLVGERIARWCSDCSESHDQVETVADPNKNPKTKKEKSGAQKIKAAYTAASDYNATCEAVTSAAAMIHPNNPMLAVRAIRPRCIRSCLCLELRFVSLDCCRLCCQTKQAASRLCVCTDQSSRPAPCQGDGS